MLSATSPAMVPSMGGWSTPKGALLPAYRPLYCRQRSTARTVLRAQNDSYEVLAAILGLLHFADRHLPDRV